MPLPLKYKIDAYYLFPKVKIMDGQPCVLWKMPMVGSTLHAQLGTFSKIYGFLNPFYSY
jgi:hypothetical protein